MSTNIYYSHNSFFLIKKVARLKHNYGKFSFWYTHIHVCAYLCHFASSLSLCTCVCTRPFPLYVIINQSVYLARGRSGPELQALSWISLISPFTCRRRGSLMYIMSYTHPMHSYKNGGRVADGVGGGKGGRKGSSWRILIKPLTHLPLLLWISSKFPLEYLTSCACTWCSCSLAAWRSARLTSAWDVIKPWRSSPPTPSAFRQACQPSPCPSSPSFF